MPAPSVKSTRKRPVRKRASSAKKKHRSPLTYVLWAVGGFVAIVCATFVYKTLTSHYLPRWRAVHGKVEYPKGEVRGIDVSRYQENIDWAVLRNSNLQGAPVSFVFVKATEGKDHIDKYFNYNFHQARQSGIVRGAYHFYSTQSPAKAQAEFFCRTVQLEHGDLPPVLDVETTGDYSKQKLQTELLIWLQQVEAYYDVKPIIYASKSFKQKYLNAPQFDNYPFWIAHYYIDSLTYTGDWHFWQHTDVGRVEGIGGYVDVNLFNGTYEELLNLTINDSLQSATDNSLNQV